MIGLLLWLYDRVVPHEWVIVARTGDGVVPVTVTRNALAARRQFRDLHEHRAPRDGADYALWMRRVTSR